MEYVIVVIAVLIQIDCVFVAGPDVREIVASGFSVIVPFAVAWLHVPVVVTV
jgi:hypothetical protein